VFCEIVLSGHIRPRPHTRQHHDDTSVLSVVTSAISSIILKIYIWQEMLQIV
jgi:hypothetical protein